ncbi:hypothetical protein [Bombilactobacillus bombi]|uniref:hypothetical protein n=1 Tax=Bombilactobacillus bombi TaxID=1303590 RepID=UPI0015E59EF9|nr:hypothetical protein [Bombilactobacillus bombi]MBA1435111.1 hypothetical protein [Bombilactobacillus bombi]
MEKDKYKLAVAPSNLRIRSAALFPESKPLLVKVDEQTGEVKFYLDPSDLEKIQNSPITKKLRD